MGNVFTGNTLVDGVFRRQTHRYMGVFDPLRVCFVLQIKRAGPAILRFFEISKGGPAILRFFESVAHRTRVQISLFTFVQLFTRLFV